MSTQLTPSLRLELLCEQSDPREATEIDIASCEPGTAPWLPEIRPEFCDYCQELRTFVFTKQCSNGRLGNCRECNWELFLPFSRAVTEAE
jgi:hypothetical protein